ncbi:MAG: tetratricopeptide repeat protein [Alphaproteobacteria bacterium]|nr:tetratricopeptide repeat protein [Alphaproteobacteria bacterium]
MSEATARLLLAELDATEALLRGLAAENLSYARILGVERIAHTRCDQLLAEVGFAGPVVRSAPAPLPMPVQVREALEDEAAVSDLEAHRDETDELLTGQVPAVNAEPALAVAAEVAVADLADEVGYEAIDEGPEGVADEAVDLDSDELPELALGEDDLLPELDDLEPLDDEDTAESPEEQNFDESMLSDAQHHEPELEDATEPAPLSSLSPTEDYEPEPEPSRGDSHYVSYVAYEDEAEEAEVESDDVPTLGGRRAATEDPYAHLVSFGGDEAPAEEEEEHEIELGLITDDDHATTVDWEAVLNRRDKRTPPPVEDRDDDYDEVGDYTPGLGRGAAVMSDVGRDALVTMEEHSTVLMGDMLSRHGGDDIAELELDPEDGDSFDLMPDTSDEVDVEEDDEVTLHKAEPESSRAKAGTPIAGRPLGQPQARPAAAVGVGTGGLYGGATVPTIRDSDDPRPRAAAVQLGAGGAGGRMLGLEEEEEPIEIGAAEDYDPDYDDSDQEEGEGGFSLQVQEYEEVYEEEEEELEEYEDDEVIEQRNEPPPGPSAAELQALFQQAHNTATNGDLQAGADLFSDLIDQDPDNVDAHVARGRLYLDLGDYSRAMSDFMVAEDLAPDSPEPQVAIGDLYFARKDYRKAIDFFNIALELSPDHPMAFCRRGISHYYRKNYPEAVADLLKAQKLDPDIPNIQTYVSMAKKKSK